jgi:hypothetical protein
MIQSLAEKHLRDEISQLKEGIRKQERILSNLKYECFMRYERKDSAIEFQKELIRRRRVFLESKEKELIGLLKTTGKKEGRNGGRNKIGKGAKKKNFRSGK